MEFIKEAVAKAKAAETRQDDWMRRDTPGIRAAAIQPAAGGDRPGPVEPAADPARPEAFGAAKGRFLREDDPSHVAFNVLAHEYPEGSAG